MADREHVTFEPNGATVDVAVLGRDAAAFADAPLEALTRAAALYRGELLEGLDLPECYRYHEWCVAEREAVRRTRYAILSALVDRLSGDPAEALRHARVRVSVDPLAETAHISVMHLLARLGRVREAMKQYESCRRILEAQLGRGPSRDLELARSALGQVPPADPHQVSQGGAAEPAVRTRAPATDADRAPSPGVSPRPLAGRAAERADRTCARRREWPWEPPAGRDAWEGRGSINRKRFSPQPQAEPTRGARLPGAAPTLGGGPPMRKAQSSLSR